jgi:allophanate hydrolase
VIPTAGRHYTIAEMQADPIRLNSNLGIYTNFVNLLDLAAIAVPTGVQPDGLPFGITLVAPAWTDDALAGIAGEVHRAAGLTLGATAATLPPERTHPTNARLVRVAVCGAHMAGLPLNRQLTDRGGRLLRACRSAPAYRLYALPGGPPFRPGMVRSADGRAIELEVWELPVSAFGSFVAGMPGPLGIGTVELEDGERVKGFICEDLGTKGARDITDLGGWRAYLAEAAKGPAVAV